MKNLLVLFSGIILTTPLFANPQEELEAKLLNLKKITQQITLLQKTLTEQQTETNALELQNVNDNKQLSLLGPQLLNDNLTLNAARTELEKTKLANKTLMTQLTQQENLFSEETQLKKQLQEFAALPTMDPTLMRDQLNNYDTVVAALERTINQMKQTLNRYNGIEAAQTININTTIRQISELQQQKSRLQQGLQIRERALTELNDKSISRKKTLSELTSSVASLQQTIIDLQNKAISLVTKEPFENLMGKLRWPLAGIVTNPVSHNEASGLWLKAGNEQDVRAIAPGKVIYANWLRGFGLLVIINHGDGYMSLYGGNEKLYTKVGDIIHEGEIIAAISSNRGQNKAGSLYFEIRHNGETVNPHKWCT